MTPSGRRRWTRSDDRPFYDRAPSSDFKFLARLSDEDAAAFFAELLEGLAHTTDDGDAGRLVEVANRWQVRAYQPDEAERSRFCYDDGPFTAPTKPLAECRSPW